MSTARATQTLAIDPTEASRSAIVYGPVDNGPLGLNLGLNFLGQGPKICSFNCVYCDLGKTELRLNRLKSDVPLPSTEEIHRAIQEAFQKIHASGPAVDGICISGNGEPTLHPEFPEIVKQVLTLRDAWMPGKPVHLFTNGVGLDTRKIADAANLLSNRIVKIDAGGEKLFKVVNSPLSRTNLARILTGVRKLKDVIVQSMFFEGDMSNTSQAEVDEWLEVIAIVKPKGVHIYGLSRPGANPGLRRCEEDTLYAIASRLDRKTHIKALVIP